MTSLDLPRLTEIAAREHAAFAAAAPFPHVVLDDFLRPEAAAALLAEFPTTNGEWKHLNHVNEKKLIFNDVALMGPATRAIVADLQSDAFLRILESLTGIGPLVSDPSLDGAGLAETRPGGFLNVHCDFLAHTTERHWSRQLNLLLFLNDGWDDAWGGALELWDEQVAHCARRIVPTFNRCVVFHTSRRSFHGVPIPVACPEGRSRKSLALYYFRDEGQALPLSPTYYVPRPGDPLRRRMAIRLDRWLVAGYSALKRYTPIGDRLASRILKHF